MNIKVSLDNYRSIIDIQELETVRSIFLNIITEDIRRRHLTQKKAADLLGIDQPKVSHITRAKIAGFSLERIMRFLTTLGYEINISVNVSADVDIGD